jgi:ATP-dependent Clp endopeptidase proteolytic subunit ClpP
MANPVKLKRPENAKAPFQLLNVDNSNEPARINIYDIIGETWWDEGITGKSFANELSQLDKTRDVDVYISSFGGDVVDGTVIYSALLQHQGTVNIIVDGWAVSIASVIAMAGDTVKISAIGMMMIHKPLNWCGGNANDMRKNADMLDKVEGSLSRAYTQKTGIVAAEIAAMLDAETWMTAEEAVALGFADEIIESPGTAISNHMNKDTLSHYKNIPQNVLNALAQEGDDSPEDKADIIEDKKSEDKNTDVDLDISDDEKTEALTTLVEDTETITAEPLTKTPTVVDQVQAETNRNMGIISACNIAGKPHLAEGYIKNKYSLEIVKNLLSEIKAGLEEQPTSHYQQPAESDNSSVSMWDAAHKDVGLKNK